MKRITNLLLILMSLFSVFIVYADDNENDFSDDYEITLTEEEEHKDSNKGHRAAPVKILCNISYANGVTIFAPEGSVEIVSYEIWDEDEEACLGMYSDERMFLEELYRLTGHYIVIFKSIDKNYKGYIQLQ